MSKSVMSAGTKADKCAADCSNVQPCYCKCTIACWFLLLYSDDWFHHFAPPVGGGSNTAAG